MDSAPGHPDTSAPGRCLNCDAPVSTPYCGECGQRAELHPLSIREFLQELAEELFHWEGKLAVTLSTLSLKPGLLTLEYWRGRRARYVGPLRLYFVASLLFFLVWSVRPPKVVNVHMEQQAGEVATEDPAAWSSKASLEIRAAAQKEVGFKRKLGEHAAAFVAQGPEAMTRRTLGGFEHMLPKAMFVLIPAFALMLRVLYRRSKRLYVEHFVFALHFHAFAFLVLAVSWLLPDGVLRSLVQLSLVAYLFWALRRTYGQGRVKTLFKETVLLSVHGVLLLVAMSIIVLIAVW